MTEAKRAIAQFLRDVLVVAAVAAAFLVYERLRGVPFPNTWFALAVVLSLVLAVLSRKPAIKGARYGGWFYALFAMLMIYLIGFHINEFTLQDIAMRGHQTFSESYETMNSNADRFKDAYIVIASAAFTLFGLLFVATRGMNIYVAVRVVAILVSFAAAFYMAVTAILFRDEAWWRFFLIVVNSTVLLGAAVIPNPWIANYVDEHPAVIAYWEGWLTQRRGWAYLPLFGIAIMPVFPVLGEALFCFGLLFQVYLGATGAATLYIIDQTKDRSDFEQILRNVLRISVPKRVADAVASMQSGRHNKSNVTQVFYSPTVPNPTPPSRSSDRKGAQ